MRNLNWLRGALAAGILMALPAGLRAEDETDPERRRCCEEKEEKYKQRYEENGSFHFGEADANGDGKVSLQEAKDYGVGKAENGRIGKERFGRADKNGDGFLSGEEARQEREHEEAAYRDACGRIDRCIENRPGLRERLQGMSEAERADFLKRIYEKVRECRDNPERREALRKRLQNRREEQRENGGDGSSDRRGSQDRREDFRDRREDFRDHREDRRDRAEDRRDAEHDGGQADKAEDRLDRAEDRRDHREDHRDRREDRGDRENGPKPPRAPDRRQ